MGQVERLSLEEVTPRQRPEIPPDFLHQQQPRAEPVLAPPQDPKIITSQLLAASLGVFHAIGMLIAVRLLLLFAMSGGFTLAIMAMQDQSYHGLFVFIAYSLLAVLPIVWLDRSERKKN